MPTLCSLIYETYFFSESSPLKIYLRTDTPCYFRADLDAPHLSETRQDRFVAFVLRSNIRCVCLKTDSDTQISVVRKFRELYQPVYVFL